MDQEIEQITFWKQEIKWIRYKGQPPEELLESRLSLCEGGGNIRVPRSKLILARLGFILLGTLLSRGQGEEMDKEGLKRVDKYTASIVTWRKACENYNDFNPNS